jgi:hypothetical protein
MCEKYFLNTDYSSKDHIKLFSLEEDSMSVKYLSH